MIGGELLVVTLTGYPVAFCLGMLVMLEHAGLIQKNSSREPWTTGIVVVMSLVGIVAAILMVIALVSGFIEGVQP